MGTVKNEIIYISFCFYFETIGETDIPFSPVSNETEEQLNSVFPHGPYFAVNKHCILELVRYIKKYLKRNKGNLCWVYCPNGDFSVTEKLNCNLYEEDPSVIKPGEYLTLGYVMSEERAFLQISYAAEGLEIYLLALEKREDYGQLLLAFNYKEQDFSEVRRLTPRERIKRSLSSEQIIFQYHIPQSLIVDGREIRIAGASMLYKNGCHNDERASVLNEYLIRKSALPEALIDEPVIFCSCEIRENFDFSFPLKHMTLQFPPKKKQYTVEQSFTASLKGEKQTLSFSAGERDITIYLEGLKLIDIFEGRDTEDMEQFKKIIGESQRLLVLAYENPDETVSPMFYLKERLDRSKRSSSDSSTGWFLSPEKGTLGSHGLPLRYAHIETVAASFCEEVELELFSVQLDVPKQEDVEACL